MACAWSRAAASPSRPSLVTAARQAFLLLAISAVLAAGLWLVRSPRVPLRADPADYELELAAPLIEVAEARRFYDEGLHLFIDTRSAGADSVQTIPGAFVIRPDSFDDDVLSLLDIIVPEDQFILFGSGNLALANNVAARMVQRGYPNVALLKGGLDAWRAAGGPLSMRRNAGTP